MRLVPVLLATALFATTTVCSAEEVSLNMVSRIKDQAFNHSQVMDYMHHLADENGPRLAASFRAAFRP
jgi:hypothetical protein